MKFYMFRAVPLSIIRSLFPVHSALVYVIQVADSFRAGPGWNWISLLVLLESCLQPVWHIPMPSVQGINSWWWAEELPETCGVSCQNKFVKLVHLVGFITEKL